MRELTPGERETLKRRTEAFPNFLSEMYPGISELAKILGVPKPDRVMEEPDNFLKALETFLAFDTVSTASEQMRTWLHVRLMFFFGELLIRRYGGYWFLQSDPDSDLFLRYVVHIYEEETEPQVLVDPAETILRLMSSPHPRSFVKLLYSVETSLARHKVQPTNHLPTGENILRMVFAHNRSLS